MTSKFYTGIGSRKTPENILKLMTLISVKMEQLNYCLRSGGAEGADTAFSTSVKNKIIYLPWKNFNNNLDSSCIINSDNLPFYKEAEKIVLKLHDNPETLLKSKNEIGKGSGLLKLHTRNIYQVRGHLQEPIYSKGVIYYSLVDKNKLPLGGTKMAVTYALSLNIPCYNLYFEKDREYLINTLNLSFNKKLI